MENNIPTPECEGGYTRQQVEEIMGDRLAKFDKWMYGQTCMLCEGRKWNYNAQKYEPSCGGVAHGGIVYEWDLKRFLGIYGQAAKDLWD